MILRKIAALALFAMIWQSGASGQPMANNVPRTMSWLYSGTRTVMIEDPNGQWYRVALTVNCPSLKTAVDVTVRHFADGRTQLLTGGGRCDIASITQVSDTSLHSTHQ